MRIVIHHKFDVFFLRTIGILSLVSIILSIYFSIFVEYFFKFNSFKPILYALGIFLFGIYSVLTNKLYINKPFFYYIVLAFPIAFVSVFFWKSLKEINVYLVILTLIAVISIDLNLYKKYLLYLFYFSVLIAVIEYFQKKYFIIVFRDTPWGIKALDEGMFGGNSGVFRSKALFDGPLALGQFAIGLSILFRKDFKVIMLAFIVSFLANSRLGLAVIFMILLLYISQNIEKVKKIFKTNILLNSIILMGFFVYIISRLDIKTIERIKTMFSSKDSSNDARFYYWEKGIELFSRYDFFHLIFGNSGYYSSIYKNNAENGWITLLLNNGILGFLFYLLPLLLLLYLSIKKKTNHFYYIILLFLAMFIQTFHMGGSASLIFWIIIYSFFVDLRPNI